MRDIVCKLGNMRSEKSWTVYPRQSNDNQYYVVIQADSRIAAVDLKTGKARLSRHVAGGAYFVHLTSNFTVVDVPDDVLAALKAMPLFPVESEN